MVPWSGSSPVAAERCSLAPWCSRPAGWAIAARSRGSRRGSRGRAVAERPLRILMIVGPATGGIGAHAAALSGDVAKGSGGALPGAVVAVVCPEITASRFAWRVPVERAWPAGRPGALWRSWRRVRELVATADVVHAHGHQAGMLALAAAARTRPRPAVVVSWHNAVLAS